MDSSTTSVLNRPKMSQHTLEAKANYYVIHDGQRYHYFPIKVEVAEISIPLFRLEKSPPVLMEGIAILGKRFYKVPIQDLLRGIVRKSREIKPAKRVATDGNSGIARTPNRTPRTRSKPEKDSTSKINPLGGVSATPELSDIHKFGFGSAPTLEIGSEANRAWTAEVESILYSLSEEEGGEWEIADPVQSISGDESGPI